MGNRKKAFDLDVIVDLVFDEGLLFLCLRNIGARPARDVSVSFDQDIARPHGDGLINELRLFRCVPFLGPGRSVDVFVGTSAAYFASGQPERIVATVAYLDSRGKRRRGRLEHDLGIYADLGYVRRDRKEHGSSHWGTIDGQE